MSSQARKNRTARRAAQMAQAVTAKVATKSDLDRVLNTVTQVANQIDRMDFGDGVRLRTKAGERDVDQVLGYLAKPTYDDYVARYRRRPMARRAINLPITKAWDRRLTIEAATADSREGDPKFRQQIEQIIDRTKLFRAWQQVDRFCAFGPHAVLLIGLAGQTDLAADPERVDGPDGVIYVKAYSSKFATIQTWDTDPGSERYGLPETYRLEFRAPGQTGATIPAQTVHWRRIVHVSDENLHSDVIGEARMQAIINDLDDLVKTTGGAAEMAWQGAAPTFVANAIPEADLSTDDISALRLQLERMVNGLTRMIATAGVDVKTLPSISPDPRPIFEVLISNIAAATGIPQRMLIGSERGELASEQDERSFGSTIEDRRTEFCEPVVARSTIERLQDLGAVIEVPAVVFNWPATISSSPEKEAEVAVKRATAMKTAAEAVIAGGGLIEDEEAREQIGLPREIGAIEETRVLNERDPAVVEEFARIKPRLVR